MNEVTDFDQLGCAATPFKKKKQPPPHIKKVVLLRFMIKEGISGGNGLTTGEIES